MDKSGAAVCEFYVRIHLNQYFETSFPPQGESQLPEGRILSLQACQRGQNYCLQGSSKYGYRNLFDLIRNIEHLINLDSPSQHWLRGLCKKGDQCEFLHEYDMSKMPECYFYSRFSEWLKTRRLFLKICRRHFFSLLNIHSLDACHNKECPFLHIDPEAKVRDCPWYDRGKIIPFHLQKVIKFCRFLPAWSELQTQTCAQGALYQLPGRLLPFRTQMHRCPSKVWTAWPRRHGPENGQKGRFQSHRRNRCYFTHPRLWLHATTVEKSGTKFLTATKCPRFHFFCLGCLTFLLRPSKLCLLQELKDQQVNELGKTFMPYTQSNYRMHPMVVMPTKNGEFTVILQGDGRPHRFKTLDEITCFKCGENGHFANKCPKVF